MENMLAGAAAAKSCIKFWTLCRKEFLWVYLVFSLPENVSRISNYGDFLASWKMIQKGKTNNKYPKYNCLSAIVLSDIYNYSDNGIIT